MVKGCKEYRVKNDIRSVEPEKMRKKDMESPSEESVRKTTDSYSRNPPN